VKPGAFLATIVIVSPVFGFLPFLALRARKENVPNPVRMTFSLRLSASLIPLRNTLIASFEALFVRFPFFATSSISSFFVTDRSTHPLSLD